MGSCKEVTGPHHSGTATSAWGLKTMRHSPLGDCCNCEGAWSRTYSISSATVGEGEERAQSGSLRGAPWGSLLDPGIPAHAFIWNPTLKGPANVTNTLRKMNFLTRSYWSSLSLIPTAMCIYVEVGEGIHRSGK